MVTYIFFHVGQCSISNVHYFRIVHIAYVPFFRLLFTVLCFARCSFVVRSTTCVWSRGKNVLHLPVFNFTWFATLQFWITSLCMILCFNAQFDCIGIKIIHSTFLWLWIGHLSMLKCLLLGFFFSVVSQNWSIFFHFRLIYVPLFPICMFCLLFPCSRIVYLRTVYFSQIFSVFFVRSFHLISLIYIYSFKFIICSLNIYDWFLITVLLNGLAI